jgi:hypothetical protein
LTATPLPIDRLPLDPLPERPLPMSAIATAMPLASQLPQALRPGAAPRTWKYIVLHHTATEAGDVATINEAHRQRTDSAGRPWLGIGYHFVIGNGRGMADGLVEPTFRWTDQLHGAHAASRQYNEHGIGVCLVGNFSEQPPTQRQLAAAQKLVAQLRSEYRITRTNVVRHSDLSATECPGELFPLDSIVAPPEPEPSEASSIDRTVARDRFLDEPSRN